MSLNAADLSVKIFADGADKEQIRSASANPLINGFTTNPTLMRKSGVTNYEAFAKEVIEIIPDHSLSLEVFADDLAEMERQAREIAGWGRNVYVKVPISNTKGEATAPILETLSRDGIKLNVTALMTEGQVRSTVAALNPDVPSYISVFAGRVADTGIDPIPVMKRSLSIMEAAPKSELIWASPREVLNVVQASEIGCHVITVTYDILNKLGGLGKDLDAFSLDTVKMFHQDATASGFSI
jgi:transaldolase